MLAKEINCKQIFYIKFKTANQCSKWSTLHKGRLNQNSQEEKFEMTEARSDISVAHACNYAHQFSFFTYFKMHFTKSITTNQVVHITDMKCAFKIEQGKPLEKDFKKLIEKLIYTKNILLVLILYFVCNISLSLVMISNWWILYFNFHSDLCDHLSLSATLQTYHYFNLLSRNT